VETTAAVTQIRSLDACIVCPEIRKTTELIHATFNPDIVTEMYRILLCVEFWQKSCQGTKIWLFSVLIKLLVLSP
jgi:hypothetical protein